MEALLIIGALAAGAHYITKEEDPTPHAVYSSQTTEEIANFGTEDTRARNMAMIDWTKPGNFVVGDSPETGVQWVFETN